MSQQKSEKEQQNRDIPCSPEDVKCGTFPDMLEGWSGGDGTPCNRQKHSLIEKRRRKKMNSYITELSTMLSNCPSPNKLDKISVLRRAVQHVKSIQGATNVYWNSNKPPLVSDLDMKALIEQESNEMLFVITCDDGKFIHISQKMTDALGVSKNDWIGLSIFEKLHTKDIPVVKEQLSYASQITMCRNGTSPHEGISSGSWRSFFCRLKTQRSPPKNFGDNDSNADQISRSHGKQKLQVEHSRSPANVMKEFHFGKVAQNYITIHCIGFMKACEEVTVDDESVSDESKDSKRNCLILAGSVVKPTVESEIPGKAPDYHARLDDDGRISHVDKNVGKFIGHTPQELVGSSIYDTYHRDDRAMMEKVHRVALKSRDHVLTPDHRVKSKNGNHVVQRCDLFNFVNPWTNMTDHILCKSTVKESQGNTHSSVPLAENFPKKQERLKVIDKAQSGHESVPQPSSTAESLKLVAQSLHSLPCDEFQSRPISTAASQGSREDFSTNRANDTYSVPAYTSGMLTPEASPVSVSCFSGDTTELYLRPEAPRTFPRPNQPVLRDWRQVKSIPEDGCRTPEEIDDDPESAMLIALGMLENDVGFGGSVDFGEFVWSL